ncbi:MAG: BTAD domain-containing putative transcriptional regulator [Coriobacteriia bacterium]|nr:BTAD domain-containing putative transcriptional regulator [Coriobacteriia bacterium]
MLLAQHAMDGEYDRIAWVDADQACTSESALFSAIADQLVPDDVCAGEVEDLGSAWVRCIRSADSLDDDKPILLVVDALASGAIESVLDRLRTLSERLPVRSAVAVATRASSLGRGAAMQWDVGASDLLLDLDELHALTAGSTFGCPIPEAAERLQSLSAGQAAVAALVVRRWALTGSTDVAGDRDVESLVRYLAGCQMSDEQRRALVAASLLVDGRIAGVSECTGLGHAVELMAAVSEIIPLVRVDLRSRPPEFFVHDSVARALDCVACARDSSPDVLRRSVIILLGDGRFARATSVATESGSGDLIAQCLSACGESLMAAGSESLVRSALDALPQSVIADRPELMLLHAQSLWERSRTSEAVQCAHLADELAQHSGDHLVFTRARLLLARIRTAVGDFGGVAADLEPLVDSIDRVNEADMRASIICSAALAHGFTANRVELERIAALARDVELSPAISPQASMRLDMCWGLIAGLVDGDWRLACSLLQRATLKTDAGHALLSVAQADCAAALLMVGQVDEATGMWASALRTANLCGLAVLSATIEFSLSTVRAFEGDGSSLSASVDRALGQVDGAHDDFAAANVLVAASSAALACGKYDEAVGYSERAAYYATESTSPVIGWMARLSLAHALLACGDSARARSLADTVLPLAVAAGARGHALQAAMLISAADCAVGRTDQAIRTLSSHASSLLSDRPYLTVAVHLRTMPRLLGLFGRILGVENLPTHMLRLIGSPYSGRALALAQPVLDPSDFDALARRLLGRDGAVATVTAPEAKAPSAVCTVRLFGGFEVHTPDGPVSDRAWTKRKSRLLFAMLVSRSDKDVPRDQLIEYLWPEMQEQRALNNFYVVWSSMKRALGTQRSREEPCPYVEHIRGICRVIPGRVTSDLAEFERLLAVARKARTAHDEDNELAALHAVADVYRGELLPGDTYDDWFASLREKCRHDFEDAMLRAAEILERRDSPQEALGLLRRAMQYDPWREDLYQAALRLQISAGQRSAAIETYMLCRTRLVEDLGIDPSNETTKLYQHVLGMEDGVNPES